MADDQAPTLPSLDQPPAEPAKRSRGRPVGDREGRRIALLKAAVGVIADEGIAATSLRKVAQRAGCTTGAVSYYFASKEALMAAIIESRWDAFDGLLDIDADAGGIRRMFERWFEITTGDGDWAAGFQLLAYARHDPGLIAVYQQRYARYRERLTGILADGQRQGRIRDDVRADLLADQLGTLGDGWMMLFPIEPERFAPDRLGELLDATIAIISPEGARSN